MLLFFVVVASGQVSAAPPHDVTIGLRGYVMVPLTTPKTGSRVGAAYELPIAMAFQNSWGLRLALQGAVFSERGVTVGWWSPNAEDADGDGVWEPGESAQPVAGQRRVRQRPARTAVFGLVLALHRVFRTPNPKLRPFAGGGLIFGTVFQTLELDREEEGYVLGDKARLGQGPKPHVLQLIPGMSLHGGLGFQAREDLFFTAEVGGSFQPMGSAGIRNTIGEFAVSRAPYEVFSLRFGLGFDLSL